MGINVLFLEIQVGIAVLIILLVRPGMRKLPGIYSYMLWLVIFVRLLIPVSLESRFGVMPSAVESRMRLEEIIDQTEMTAAGKSEGSIMASDGKINAEASESGSVAAGNNGNAGITEQNIQTGTEYSVTGNYGIGNVAEQGFHMGADNMNGGSAGTDFQPDGNNESGAADILQSGGIEVHKKWQSSTIWHTVLLILWAAGAIAILAYNGIALILVKRQIDKAECLKGNIYISSQVKSPFTLGMVRPKIYLPPDLSETEQEYIICHEKVHIRRKDYLVKNIAFLLTALHWFNPFVWIAFNCMGRDMEMSCDEKVIDMMGEEIKKQYSQSLLNFAQGKCPAAITPITFGENSVKQRVSNVLSYKSASGWAAALGTAVLFLSALMIFTVRGDAQEDRESQSGNPQSEESQNENRLPSAVEDSSLAIRNVGASPEIIHAGFMLARRSPNGALEYWARAFTDRNGDMLHQLAADEEGFMQWEKVVQRGDGSFVFGDSSPWPWEYDYEITLSPEDSVAEITFHMRTSVPEIYLVREKVRITELEGLYYVDHESTRDNYSIKTAQEYEETYNQRDIYKDNSIYVGYAVQAALYDDFFYRTIFTHLFDSDNPGFYQQYTNPVTAAQELLHLGAGTGEVTDWLLLPGTLIENRGKEFSDWSHASSEAGLGSRVIVTYTFAKDGSRIEIPMELKEETQGVWGLVGGGIREIYCMVGEPEMIEHEEGKADSSPVIELSNYGIYQSGEHGGLTCLWAGDVGPEAAARVSDSRLYIFQSLERAKVNSADGTEVVFVYDFLTGGLHREHLAIPQNYQKIFPEVTFEVNGGFVQVYGWGKPDGLPLENLNEVLWNQKTFRQMTPEDKQAYGVDNRTYLLNNPDTLVQLSVREPEKTSAYIDLDGDGVSEQVILSSDPDRQGQYWQYDDYWLQAGENMITGWGSCVHNDIWAYSPDGEKIILALYEDGPSGDPRTSLFGYEKGELKELGGFPDDIRTCTMENGVISGTERCDVIQTDAIHASWRISDSGKVELVPQKVYDFAMLNDIELLEELPVQNVLPPDEEGIYNGIFHFTISPQTVHFLQTDSTFSWVYVEAADGSRGWFQMDGYTVKELGKDSRQVFDGLIFAG